jgi:SAM-dependent methyltransferase
MTGEWQSQSGDGHAGAEDRGESMRTAEVALVDVPGGGLVVSDADPSDTGRQEVGVGEEGAAVERQADASDTGPTEVGPPATPADPALAAYLLAEPFVAGKVVLDVAPRPRRAAERLARANAGQVLPTEDPPADLPAESVDVVVCASRLAAVTDAVERQRWLSELRRVLRPDGFCLVRLPVAALPGPDPVQAFEALLLDHFAVCDVVAESVLSGVSYLAPHTDDVAVNEELARFSGEPTHLVGLCAPAPTRPWSLPESLLVPLGAGLAAVAPPTGEVAALHAELAALASRQDAACQERDALREATMSLQDRLDAQEQALSSLRRETERHLRQLSDDAAALEIAALERERLERRAASAERALESQATQLQQRNAELVALERELTRLRPPPSDSSS